MSTDRSSSKLWLLAAATLALLALATLGLRERTEAAPEPASAASKSEGADPRATAPSRSAAASEQASAASGRVSSPAGSVAGAVVVLAPLDADEREPIATRSDASGEWSLTGIAPGRYALSATAAGMLPGLRPALTLAPGDNPGLDLRLEPGGNLLSGVVVDRTGGVIEGALVQVTLIKEASPAKEPTRVSAGKEVGGPDVALPRRGAEPAGSAMKTQSGVISMRERDSSFTRTDAEGRYAVQVADGRHRIRASHPDYSSEQVVVELAGAPARHDFSLVPSAVVEGVVRRESDGEPVAHAEVFWAREREVILPGGDRVQTRERGGRVVADDQGRFRVRGLPPGVVELSARAERLASEAPVQVPVAIAERAEGVELWLIAAADLRGRVVAAADGSAIAGAEVDLQSQLGPGGAAVSDGEGRFVIRGVLPGRYGARASAEGFAAMAQPTPVEVGDGEPPTLELSLAPGLLIRGRVEPAALAEVSLVLSPESLRMGAMLMIQAADAVTSDPETGEFELGPVEPGRYTLDARAADGRGGTVEVEVGERGAEGVIIALEQRATLAGVVLDQTGEPVTDASVRARRRDPERGSLSVVVNGRELTAASSPTSLDGKFEIAGLAAGVWVVDVVDAQGDRLSTAAPVTVTLVDGRREQLTLRVEARDGTITGTVRDADGHPVADAWVSAAYIPALAPEPDRDAPGFESDAQVVLASDAAGPPSLPPVLTDAEGRFRVTGLRRADYRLTAELDGGAGRASLARVRPDADVTLELAPLATLEGRVLSDGEPADCVARIIGPSERRVRVRDGRFEVERLEPGRYTVEASAGDGSTSASVTLEPGATANVELALERFSTITGKVVDASGAPIPGAELLVGSGDGGRVEVRREDGDPQYFTAPDGSFELHAAAGARVLLVQSPSSPMPIAIKPFVVEAGNNLDLGEIREQPLDGMVMHGEPEPEGDAG